MGENWGRLCGIGQLDTTWDCMTCGKRPIRVDDQVISVGY